MVILIFFFYVVFKMFKCIFMLNKYLFFKFLSGKLVLVLKELISFLFLRLFFFDKILVIKGLYF